MEREIEEQAVVMIARRQPMAYDLRQIMAALRISTDLERIGDLGKNIAKRAVAVVTEQQFMIDQLVQYISGPVSSPPPP